jgi:processive 1,2-diacylglycerol beta-glucosyltransferase
MQNKRIVILYSTGGMGHKKAAFAILEAFKKKAPYADIEAIDALEYAGKFYNFVYRDFYIFFMTKARWLWGVLYDLSNIPLIDAVTRGIRNRIDLASLKGLVPMLHDKSADAIVATHFILPSVAGELKKDEWFRSRLYTVVTDYGPHSYWLSNDMDRFFLGSGSALEEMAKRGVPRDRMTVTGIPTEGVFSGEFDKGVIRKKYSLDPEKKTIFLLSGGFGVGPMKEMLLSLNKCTAPIQVIAVCGHNKKAYEDIEKLKGELKYPVVLLGFTDKVADLMAVSDLMVTKAGGISVTEAMNARLPMILFASIPGQETWNEKMLLSSGAARKADEVKDIPVIVDSALLTKGMIEAMRDSIEGIRRPDAAEKIAETVLKDIGAS